MQRPLHVLLSLALLMIVGCSTTNDVVGRGPFQKRKYRPGWNIDIAGWKRPTDQRGSDRERTVPMEGIPVRSDPGRPAPEPLASLMTSAPETRLRTSDAPNTLSRPARPSAPIVNVPRPDPGSADKVPGPSPASTDQTDGIPRVNRMAMVSGVFLAVSLFVFALSGAIPLFTYLMVFTFITGVIGLLLAIKHRDKGKGIALLAILVVIGFLVASLSGADLP